MERERAVRHPSAKAAQEWLDGHPACQKRIFRLASGSYWVGDRDDIGSGNRITGELSRLELQQAASDEAAAIATIAAVAHHALTGE